jgi:hypothetical protein
MLKPDSHKYDGLGLLLHPELHSETVPLHAFTTSMHEMLQLCTATRAHCAHLLPHKCSAHRQAVTERDARQNAKRTLTSMNCAG